MTHVIPYAHLLELAFACASRPSLLLASLADMPQETQDTAVQWLSQHPDTPPSIKASLALQRTASTPPTGSWFEDDPVAYSKARVAAAARVFED